MNLQEQLDEQVRAAKSAYSREWRRKNPDKVREINRRYWQRRVQKLQASERRSNDAKADN